MAGRTKETQFNEINEEKKDAKYGIWAWHLILLVPNDKEANKQTKFTQTNLQTTANSVYRWNIRKTNEKSNMLDTFLQSHRIFFLLLLLLFSRRFISTTSSSSTNNIMIIIVIWLCRQWSVPCVYASVVRVYGFQHLQYATNQWTAHIVNLHRCDSKLISIS